jgi:hypothetical protein
MEGEKRERKGKRKKPERKETAETIPTQSDIFKSIVNGDGYNHRSQ